MRVFFFTLFLFLSGIISAQQVSKSDTLSPLQVVELYVSPEGFPNKLKFFCCEFYKEWGADSTLGQQLPKRVQRECKLQFQDSVHAAVSVWFHDSLTSRNIYFFLMKKQNWTLYAARSLVMTGLAETDKKRMDSLHTALGDKAYLKQTGHTYAFDQKNLLLWSATDQEQVAHFNANKKTFVLMQSRLAKKGFYGKNDSLLDRSLSDKKIKQYSNKLLIRTITHNKKLPGTVFYIVGGISDNTVGYFYQPDPKKIPPMTEKKFILVQSLGDGWYLYKTT